MTAEEVRQMVNAGFNPLQEIARTTGMTLLEVQSQMADGAVSAEMVTKALASAVAEGGRFHGMNERLAETGAGSYAKLISDLEKIGVQLGDELLPAAKQFVGALRDMAKEAGPVVFLFDKFGKGLSLSIATLRDFSQFAGTAFNNPTLMAWKLRMLFARVLSKRRS